jgi:valyl-tRNA synthetase
MELAKAYDPQEAQQKCLQLWDRRGDFHAVPDPSREPFSIVIPPPNVTGALHLGHALNNTLQDVLIRWKRMSGYNTLWMPGTDHAGIATQSVVEKRVFLEEKKTRHDLGREELVNRIWKWKDQYEKRILNQLREIGGSCDWPRTRFTLDTICARAVRETFFRMFRDGYIFRGKRLVNWDTQLQTSVADDETYVEDTKGGFWTFKYPVIGLEDTFIRFSTTRPETMLGDTAVCVHPDDKRYKHLIGKKVRIPLNGREIPIIADGELADPTLGTGCVKLTPAHDPNDYRCWERNRSIWAKEANLGLINILNSNGTLNENGGAYQGLDRYKAREGVVKEMEEKGFFEGKEDRVIPLAYSDRSKSPIEPYLSDQWFVKMGDRDDGRPSLAQMAMDAVTSGKVTFTPERYAKTYLDWLSEKRDWCISRQLWWGHRIAIWYTKAPEAILLSKFGKRGDVCWRFDAENQQYLIASLEELPENLLGEEFPLIQETDVLDTWFSSALWPHSTLGWPEETAELKQFYPTSVLSTSRDIITLWVARMVMMGLYNRNEIPFRQVYVHPKVMDGFGETMSKSKGNGVDPLDIISLYGTDAMRFGMTQLATETQDARLPVSNVCPHCGVLNPVKQEHMYMRTRKMNCAACKQPFRPGGPWPEEDTELKTARQASDRFEVGRNFANKLWNATRFILMNLEGYTPGTLDLQSLPMEDRWILSRLSTVTEEVTKDLHAFKFAAVTDSLYRFIWSEFCDWYIEMAKGRFKDENPAQRATMQRTLIVVLDGILKLVHPVMPFISETLWQAIREVDSSGRSESIMVAPWPSFPKEWQSPEIETRFARMQELVRGVREVRNRYMLDARKPLDTFVRCSAEVSGDFQALSAFIVLLAGVGELQTGPTVQKPKQASTQLAPEFEAFVSLEGLIDPVAETKRLEKQLQEKKKQLDGTQKKLQNADFVARAPQEVVQQQKELIEELQQQIQIIEATLKDFAS